MMYPFMTLDDNTEVVHSEMLPDGRVRARRMAGCSTRWASPSPASSAPPAAAPTSPA